MNLRTVSVLSILAATGCAHAPRAFVFNTERTDTAALDVLAQSLSQKGHHVSRIQGSEITTYWEDTGYQWRETEDLEDQTDVFLRFHVEMTGTGSGRRVIVRADVQRCVPYRAVVTPTEVLSTCEPMAKILPTHQKVVDDLGKSLATALSSSKRSDAPVSTPTNGDFG